MCTYSQSVTSKLTGNYSQGSTHFFVEDIRCIVDFPDSCGFYCAPADMLVADILHYSCNGVPFCNNNVNWFLFLSNCHKHMAF